MLLERLATMIQSAADWLFMPWVVGILLGAGLFLSVRTGFVQIRRFAEACRLVFVRRASGTAGALTPFQAFMTALAASIGTGNIAGVPIVDNGFVKTINNSVAISFGIDWVHYEIDDWCDDWPGPGPGNCYWGNDADILWLPVAMQWNFFLSENWSVFGEPGLALRINDNNYDDDLDLDFVFYAGGRYHFGDTASLTMRLGWPSAFTIGVSFFL